MDRLTTKFCGDYVPRELCIMDSEGNADDCELCFESCKAFEGGNGEVDCNGCTISKCFNALGEYENTGLTPEQIVEIDHLYKEKCKELAKYKKLRQQGRAPILPCKIGQTVYAVAFNETKIITGEVVSIRIGASGGSLRIYIPSDGQYIRRAFEQIGKSVFFDQAAAREALKKERGNSMTFEQLKKGQITAEKIQKLEDFLCAFHEPMVKGIVAHQAGTKGPETLDLKMDSELYKIIDDYLVRQLKEAKKYFEEI